MVILTFLMIIMAFADQTTPLSDQQLINIAYVFITLIFVAIVLEVIDACLNIYNLIVEAFKKTSKKKSKTQQVG